VWHHKGEPWHFLNALIAVGKNVQRVNVLELNPLFLELGVPTNTFELAVNRDVVVEALPSP